MLRICLSFVVVVVGVVVVVALRCDPSLVSVTNTALRGMLRGKGCCEKCCEESCAERCAEY